MVAPGSPWYFRWYFRKANREKQTPRNRWRSSRDPSSPPSWRSLRRARMTRCHRCYGKRWCHGAMNETVIPSWFYTMNIQRGLKAWWSWWLLYAMIAWWLRRIWTWTDRGYNSETWWLKWVTKTSVGMWGMWCPKIMWGMCGSSSRCICWLKKFEADNQIAMFFLLWDSRCLSYFGINDAICCWIHMFPGDTYI